MYRSLLFSVYLPGFLMSICQGSVMLTIPLFALDMGANIGITAIVFSLRGLGNMAADIPAGYATARFGDKNTMMAGIGFMALAGLLTSQASSPLHLAAAAFAFGVAMATWLLARLSHVSEKVPSHQRGKAISTMAGVQRFGNLIGPVGSGLIALYFGFGYVFASIGIVAFAALVLVFLTSTQNLKSQSPDRPGLLRLVPHIISKHQRVFATAGIAVLCLTVLRASRQLLVPLWGQYINLDSATIGFVVGTAAAIDMLMFPLAGYAMDNLGRRYAAISCLVLQTIGIFLIPFTSGVTGFVLATMVAGAGNGLGSGINMTLGADFAPAHERGEFLGVWRLVSDSGSFAGPVFLGYIATSIALANAFTAVSIVGLLGAAIMLLFVKETLVRK
jgi:MFS family permease